MVACGKEAVVFELLKTNWAVFLRPAWDHDPTTAEDTFFLRPEEVVSQRGFGGPQPGDAFSPPIVLVRDVGPNLSLPIHFIKHEGKKHGMHERRLRVRGSFVHRGKK